MNKQERYEAFVLPEGAKKCVPRPGGLGAEGQARVIPAEGAAAVRAPCGPGCSRSSARRTPSSAGRPDPYPLGAAANGGSRNRPGAERTQPPFPFPDPDPAPGPDPAPVHGPGTLG